MRRFVFALCVFLSLAVVSGAAAGTGGSKTGQACYKGAYGSYLDPATGYPFASQSACVSYVANGGTLTTTPAAKCFDPSWSLIKDQGSGADGTATSGIPCADFVAGGGSLAGVKAAASGNETASVSWTIDAFAVNSVTLSHSSTSCSGVGGPCGGGAGDDPPVAIGSPYTYSDTGSVVCVAGGLVERHLGYSFVSLGGHGMGTLTFGCRA